MIQYIVVAVCGYIVGSVPTGFWIAQKLGIDDITKHGSGNIGATNVSRVLGTRYFFLVFFLDALKAYLYLRMITGWYQHSRAMLLVAWFAVLIGNSHSIFLRGRGGKGVSTAIGLVTAVVPYVTLLCISIWAAVFALARNAGLASLCAMTALPFCVYGAGQPPYFVICCAVTTIWLWWRHYENIKRMVHAYSGHTRSTT